MKHIIKDVMIDSIGLELGLEPGDSLLKINDTILHDFVDYNYFMSFDEIDIIVEKANGELEEYIIEKDPDESLGLVFENEFMGKQHHCRNKCMFCFIDQLPEKMRKTMYFKDDDWRLSFLMGNYVTLTNVDDEEFQRIIDRGVSPLFISVHATDKEVRQRMLHNKHTDILPRLKELQKHGIRFHCQIVLCGGVNDGAVLEKTLKDLYSLDCLTVAIVPIGITKYREGLAPVTCIDKANANNVLDLVDFYREKALAEKGSRFVFPSDEMYILAGRDFPEYDAYEGFAQIEDGVGLFRLLEHDFLEAIHDLKKNKTDIALVTGVLAKPLMEKLINHLPNKEIPIFTIKNKFFGETITVAGLITGGDIIEQLKDKQLPPTLIIPEVMVKANEKVFLDDVTIDDLEKALNTKVTIVKNNGYSLAEAFGCNL